MNKEVHYFPGEICLQFLRVIWIKNSYAAFAKSSNCCLVFYINYTFLGESLKNSLFYDSAFPIA